MLDESVLRGETLNPIHCIGFGRCVLAWGVGIGLRGPKDLSEVNRAPNPIVVVVVVAIVIDHENDNDNDTRGKGFLSSSCFYVF